MCKKTIDKVPKVIGVAVTFLIAVLLWTIFRAEQISQAFAMIKTAMSGQFGAVSPIYTEIMNELIEIRILSRFGLQGVMDLFPSLPLLTFLAALLYGIWFLRNTQEKMEHLRMNYAKIAVTVLLMTWSIFSLSEISQFVYFSF